jgi:hypothetical protein
LQEVWKEWLWEKGPFEAAFEEGAWNEFVKLE